MPLYGAEFNRAISTTASTVGSFGASSGTQARRLKLMAFFVGSETTPADQAYLFTVQRYTAAGTSTAIVPKPFDLADPVLLGVAGENHTVEPTYTAAEVLFSTGSHQRDRIVYYAPPDGAITVPATNAAGLGFLADVSSGTPNLSMSVHILE